MKDTGYHVRRLDRQQITSLLERYGFAVHERETTDELRDALVANVDDGTVPKFELWGRPG